jgi:hypothetical protein
LEEVMNIIRQNVLDLRQLMDSTRVINDDNVSFIKQKREEICKMREQ